MNSCSERKTIKKHSNIIFDEATKVNYNQKAHTRGRADYIKTF